MAKALLQNHSAKTMMPFFVTGKGVEKRIYGGEETMTTQPVCRR
jgi:hypothetical protein